eukprot:snap_masked-scaffold_3-processed-gene-21.33-mRNA-1 protein AED:1.00 eAED:1.00 QI:0/0/0/0/1/1/2/0/63
MSFIAQSIRQQFENRNTGKESYDEEYKPMEEARFKEETENFLPHLEKNEDITLLTCFFYKYLH